MKKLIIVGVSVIAFGGASLFFVNATSSMINYVVPAGKNIHTGNFDFMFDGQNFSAIHSGTFVLTMSAPIKGCTATNNCNVVFQEDGNVVMYNQGKAFFATHSQEAGSETVLHLSDEAPFLSLVDRNGVTRWAANVIHAPYDFGGGDTETLRTQNTPYTYNGHTLGLVYDDINHNGQTEHGQFNGNIELGGSDDGHPSWIVKTTGPACYVYQDNVRKNYCDLVFESGGNFVLYNSNNALGTPVNVWSTNTDGHPGSTIQFALDGKSIQIIDVNGNILWSSND